MIPGLAQAQGERAEFKVWICCQGGLLQRIRDADSCLLSEPKEVLSCELP